MHLKWWNPKKGRIGKKEAAVKKNKDLDCVGMKKVLQLCSISLPGFSNLTQASPQKKHQMKSSLKRSCAKVFLKINTNNTNCSNIHSLPSNRY